MTDSLVPLLRAGDKLLNDDGTPTEWFRNAWNSLVLRTGTETENTVLGVINGAAQLQAQINAANAARIAGDRANGAGGDGSGTSNGGTWSAGASAGVSWVVLKTLTVTPGAAAGTYAIAVTPDDGLGLIAPASGGFDTFAGEWRLVEELTGGGTEYVIAEGEFGVSFTPQYQQYLGEGSTEVITIPAMTIVAFTGLPSAPIAANEAAVPAPVDIRLEIRRASGTNEVSQLSGAMTVAWAA